MRNFVIKLTGIEILQFLYFVTPLSPPFHIFGFYQLTNFIFQYRAHFKYIALIYNLECYVLRDLLVLEVTLIIL